MAIKQIIRAEVLGATRYSFDGNQGVKIYLQDTPDNNQDVVGREITTLSGEYGVFEVLKKHPVPGAFEFEAIMKKGAQGKATLYVTGCRPSGPAQPPK